MSTSTLKKRLGTKTEDSQGGIIAAPDTTLAQYAALNSNALEIREAKMI